MKNVEEYQKKNCIVLPVDDFGDVVKSLFGKTADFEIDYDGISVYCFDDDGNVVPIDSVDVFEKLAEYFDVEEVTSYHPDDYIMFGTGVWIVYTDGEEYDEVMRKTRLRSILRDAWEHEECFRVDDYSEADLDAAVEYLLKKGGQMI